MAKTIWLNKYITINPKVRFGKPCIRGMRIAVEDVLNLIKMGYTIEEVIKEYPDLTKKDIEAAIDFATQILKREEILITK